LVVVRRAGICVVTTGRKELAVIVDTLQDRSIIYCVTPLITRVDSKSFALICTEQILSLDQISMATQLNIDRHNSMQSATDDNE